MAIWVNLKDQTVHFPLEHDGQPVRGKVSWRALEEKCGCIDLHEAGLVHAFLAQEARIRVVALRRLRSGAEPVVKREDL